MNESLLWAIFGLNRHLRLPGRFPQNSRQVGLGFLYMCASLSLFQVARSLTVRQPRTRLLNPDSGFLSRTPNPCEENSPTAVPAGIRGYQRRPHFGSGLFRGRMTGPAVHAFTQRLINSPFGRDLHPAHGSGMKDVSHRSSRTHRELAEGGQIIAPVLGGLKLHRASKTTSRPGFHSYLKSEKTFGISPGYSILTCMHPS